MSESKDIKMWFRRIRDEQKEISQLQEMITGMEMSLLPKAITYDKDKVQVSPDDRFGEVCAKITDYQEVLGRSIVKLKARQILAEQMIASLEDMKEREVMRYYYLTTDKGQVLTWRQVAIRMNYYEQYVKRIHGRAIEKLSKRYNISKNL